jgi:hypothetical protein
MALVVCCAAAGRSHLLCESADVRSEHDDGGAAAVLLVRFVAV